MAPAARTRVPMALKKYSWRIIESAAIKAAGYRSEREIRIVAIPATPRQAETVQA
jgi:hypothetical protein